MSATLPLTSILFESADHTVVVIDIPKSIEEAQEQQAAESTQEKILEDGLRKSRPRRRLVSTPAPTEPFATPLGLLDTSHDAYQSPASQLSELTTMAAVEEALCQLKCANFVGPWCLPRYTLQVPPTRAEPTHLERESGGAFIPPGARFLNGAIANLRDEFVANAPQFDLIVLDPPWPNRSARRRQQGRKSKNGASNEVTGADHGYNTARDMRALSDILKHIPAGSKLTETGFIAVWVTNKPSCEALLTDPKHGVFRAWGVELVATWTWLKVTTSGEPIVSVDSHWRRPWERLLLARRLGSDAAVRGAGKAKALPLNRVIVGVPDVHSRKPHLRLLMSPFLAPTSSGDHIKDMHCGLEVFARNLTAGWWSWGDEVLLFQHPSWWSEDTEENQVDAESNERQLSS
ncbi:hypothetical protein SEPCBS57363_003312 [Sporothrix epigloea]|uniref:MT-A70-domain-containing protein n=1 Tax=Sporothrix epigloea TaxID=1892477 RepID=A0ABP0DKR9_9PEZI